jgi:hypothetical protein
MNMRLGFMKIALLHDLYRQKVQLAMPHSR